MKRTISLFICSLLVGMVGAVSLGWGAEEKGPLPFEPPLAEFIADETSSPSKEEHSKGDSPSPEKKKLSPAASILVGESLIALNAAIGFIDHGAGILGGLYILSSPLNFNGPPNATGAQMVTGFVGFWGLAAYNFYLERADVPKIRVFRDNVIGMHLIILSATGVGAFSRKSTSNERVSLRLHADSEMIGMNLNVFW